MDTLKFEVYRPLPGAVSCIGVRVQVMLKRSKVPLTKPGTFYGTCKRASSRMRTDHCSGLNFRGLGVPPLGYTPYTPEKNWYQG